MINALTTALGGLQAATQKVNGAANVIADPAQQDKLVEGVVDLKLGEASFKANASVIRTAGEMSDELLHIFDEKV
jgi:flagellar hook protein FlgE